MTGPIAMIRRAVSFIFDPVPRCDRKPKTVPARVRFTAPVNVRFTVDTRPAVDALTAIDAAISTIERMRRDPRIVRDFPKVLAGEGSDFDAIDWHELADADKRSPRSSPARLRPFDWQVEHAWPVDGWST